jgi:hypothetical protein
VLILVAEIKKEPKDYGTHYHLFIDNVLFLIQIFTKAYDAIFPKKRHKSVFKPTGLTNRIERFNCTMRLCHSRLVRKTLSFSKKLSNHVGAIWYFIHHYNANIN